MDSTKPVVANTNAVVLATRSPEGRREFLKGLVDALHDDCHSEAIARLGDLVIRYGDHRTNTEERLING